ncbi:hypothetical protein GW756_02585 [bacterium]|nr:hypothetical protein [bacterium]NCQ55897.1 hypothetical protein [Candidatus Parcubacteria bacterium]NCS67605.1 hypothetical protein [Candidatus Peregrinibacteria bacterium]NCS96230.1 hypothetical protein [bacterium]
MKGKISRNLNRIKKTLITWAEYLYKKGVIAQKSIDFTVKSSLYIYTTLWALIIAWLFYSGRISKDELLPNIKQVLLDSEYLLPFSTLAVLLLVLPLGISFFPNFINTKSGRVFLFLCILILFLSIFGKVVVTLV